MSEVNINNYEAYMLDCLEGNLSPQDTLALKAFVILHPELDLNFDEELVSLENESISFAGKQNLKANFKDALVIGYLENVLEGEEKQVADKLALNNLVFKKELELYKKTIAVPDAAIVFENKEKLKRKPKVIIFTNAISFRIAAAILLLIGLWLVVSKTLVSDQMSVPEMATQIKKESNTPKNEKLEQPQINPEKALANSSSKKLNKTNYVHAQTKKTNETLLVNKEENSTVVAVNSDTAKKQEHIMYLDTNAVKLANAPRKEKTQSTYVIEEGTDDELSAKDFQPKKNKFLNLASKALKKLNQKGLENVNGSATDDELFIGALSISKK